MQALRIVDKRTAAELKALHGKWVRQLERLCKRESPIVKLAIAAHLASAAGRKSQRQPDHESSELQGDLIVLRDNRRGLVAKYWILDDGRLVAYPTKPAK